MFPTLIQRVEEPLKALKENPFDWEAVAILARVGEILTDPEKPSRGYWPTLTDKEFLEMFYPGCASEMATLRQLPLEERCQKWEELTQREIYQSR